MNATNFAALFFEDIPTEAMLGPKNSFNFNIIITHLICLCELPFGTNQTSLKINIGTEH